MKPVRVATFDQVPVLAQLPDGTLMAIFVRKIDSFQEVAAWSSKDNGYSWSEPKTLFKIGCARTPVEPVYWNIEMLVDRDGEVHFFYLKWREGREYLDIWHSKSMEGRKSWQAPKCIWQGYTGALNSVIQLRKGRILLPFSYWRTRKWAWGIDGLTYMGKFSCTVLYSDDAGDTWHLAPADLRVPVPDLGTYGAVEPVIIELKDGCVWMLIRTQMGRLYESFSKAGVTWSEPRPTHLISSDSPVGLIRLKDGRIVLLWNCCLRFPYAYGGRHVLHAAISEDEGRMWRGYREVYRDPYRNQPLPLRGDFGTAYPFPALTKDGKVVFSTYGLRRTPYPADVPIVLFDPKWLYETVQKDDFSTGLDDWSIFGTKGVDLAPHPEKGGDQVLRIRKTHTDWPAAAVWNFPIGVRGSLRVRLSLKPGFKGAMMLITDHFSVPFDQEDQFYALYNLRIGPDGKLGPEKLEANRWYNLQLNWDCEKHECRVSLDGRQVALLPLLKASEGACYLRLRSTAEQTDKAGFLVEYVEADIN